jgi:hypothetical protein
MKKMVLVFTMAVFALTGSAFAQDPAYSNNIGLFLTSDGHLDPTAVDGTGSCGTVGEDVPFTVFVVLSKLTNPEVYGWEVKIPFKNMLKVGDTIFGDNVNAASRPDEYLVGLASPLDASIPSFAYLEGVYFSLLPSGLPAYLEAPGSEGIAMFPTFGDPFSPGQPPQLIMNGDCTAVGVEDTSFGSVKSLYR